MAINFCAWVPAAKRATRRLTTSNEMLHLLLSVSRLCSRPGSGTVCALLLRGAIPAGLLPGETLLLLRLEPLLAELLLLGLGAVATTHGLLSVSLLTHRALRGAIPTARLLAVGSVLLLPIALLRPRGRVSARLTARVRLTVTALLTLLTLLTLRWEALMCCRQRRALRWSLGRSDLRVAARFRLRCEAACEVVVHVSTGKRGPTASCERCRMMWRTAGGLATSTDISKHL